MLKRKGIILAGGYGTRLYPLTSAISKQLLPIYDKPMIYYPLSVLMLAGIREILIITTPQDLNQFKRLLGDGSQWGINLSYKKQETPDGLASAFILAEKFLNGSSAAMILGDNVFWGNNLSKVLERASNQESGATVFVYHVADPERYGVVGFNKSGIVKEIIEKPKSPPSNYAVTGLYFVDATASQRAKEIQKSARGELEITSLLESYMCEGKMQVEKMGRGYAWLDTGTHVSLIDASNFVRTLIDRQGLQVGCPEEVAYKMSWITGEKLLERASLFKNNPYGQYLKNLL